MSFDQRHLTALHSQGLVSELPYELGAFPIVDVDHQVRQDLIEWNVVDAVTGELTVPAAELFAGVTDYQWALSGVLLLYSERQPVVVDIPDEMAAYNMQYSVRDIPRVGFLIGVGKDTLTTLTLAAGNVALASDPVSRPGDGDRTDRDIATIIMNLCDPQRQWAPYPMSEVAIPAVTAQNLADGRQDSPEDRAGQITATRKALQAAKMSPSTCDALADLLNCENVASAQVGLTVRTKLGRTRALNNAMGLMYFAGRTNRGVVVSYPSRSFVGADWITYESATVGAVAKGIGALRRSHNLDGASLVTV